MSTHQSIRFLICIGFFAPFFSLFGCASKSMVTTDPPGGEIYMTTYSSSADVAEDKGTEVKVGTAPVLVEGKPFKTYIIRAVKGGCEGTKKIKAKELDAERAALGCCACGLPGLLGAGLVLPEEIEVRMKCPGTESPQEDLKPSEEKEQEIPDAEPSPKKEPLINEKKEQNEAEQ